ncbi:MAG TPA: hypothetical protein VI454_01695 [Verrucomicrobiae bacterium]|jgi:hypothetical protein
MNVPRNDGEVRPESGPGKAASTESSPRVEAGSAKVGGVDAVNKLTAEEQMALFEKELKENDWGHQPC